MPIAENQGRWLELSDSRGLSVKILEVSWPNNLGTINVEYDANRNSFAVISLELEPGTYRVSAVVNNRHGTTIVTDDTRGYAESKETVLLLMSTSRFARFRQKLVSAEGLLGTAILALTTILIGVLKDKIKNSFNKLLDFLGKYFGGKLAERRFLRRYLDNLTFNHRYLRLIGFNTVGISRPLLEEVFVSLRIASSVVHVDTGNNEIVQDLPTISFNSAFKQHRCMAILGAPGAGKTTTLSYALLAFAQTKAVSRLGVDEQLLPIYVPLRRLSNTHRSIIEDVTDKDTQILSPEILKEYPPNYFERKLKKGQCLLLLDGLDEVLDEKTHREIAEKINSLVAAYPKNRFVVTCRTAGWKNLLTGEFKVLVAQDFNRDEIRRFVLGWHKAVITQSEHTRLQLDIPDKKKFEEAWEARKREFVGPAIDVQSRSLIHAIDRNNRILAIAVNPMLLSLISLVHFNRQYLPRGRTVLYSQCIELLIDSWDRTRDILSQGGRVTSVQKEAVLREIAFSFQVRGKGEDSRENLERLISAIALRLGISTPAKELLEDIETRSGLLVERSLDVFGFSHLTLQEYLVAKHIQLNQNNHGLLSANFNNQAWREVILLHTGLVDDATGLIEGVASSESLDRQMLAGYCVGDAQHCAGNVSAEIINRLSSALTQNNDKADELINVLATIAANFSKVATTVEEQLTAQLLMRINDDSSLKSDRLHAIAILGRGRVTRALNSLIASMNDKDEAIRKEATKAIILFGDLALPSIEESLSLIDVGNEAIRQVAVKEAGRFGDHAVPSIEETLRERPDRDFVLSIINVLSGINTSSSARVLLRLYELDDMHFPVSHALSRMMTNPFVEGELLELETTHLPTALKRLALDRGGWSYKSARSGFWFLDTQLRHDVSKIIESSSPFSPATPLDGENPLSSISFTVMFPAFLSYLRSLPKLPVGSGGEKIAEDRLRLFGALGFDQTEPNKIHYLDNQIRSNSAIPLDLALQRVDSTQEADYTGRTSLAKRFFLGAALVYFTLLYVIVLLYGFGAAWTLFYELSEIESEFLLAISAGALTPLFYVAIILLTKRKLKTGFASKQFVYLVMFPTMNFMRVLPYITKYRPGMKLVVFQILALFFSPFGVALFVLLSGFSVSDSIVPILIVQTVVFLSLSTIYWKYRVRAQNPVYELIKMHPQGRKLISETN